MTIGALAIGTIAGRRKALIFAVASFSAFTTFTTFTALCALAPSVFVFGLLRFLARLGLCGRLPVTQRLQQVMPR
ncbi:hypothetical protein [Saccharopolyspora spinosa]